MYPGKGGEKLAMKIFLAEMTWPEVEERLKESNIAIIPVGSTEQHGPALPLNNDIFTAYTLAKMAVDQVKEDVKPVIMPPIPFGVSEHHMGFPGTISLRPETFINVIVDVCKSLIHHGFKKIVIVNGHGGNDASLSIAAAKVKRETGAFVTIVNWWTLAGDIIQKVVNSPLFHACETETSVALAIGQNVYMDKTVKEIPQTAMPNFLKYDLFAKPPVVEIPIDMKSLTKSGVIGDATRASPEKGKQIVDVVVSRLAEFLRELKSLQQPFL
jgi:creatinine amidohydrolase